MSVGGGGSLRQHFLDMGLIPGKTIEYIKAAPMGDPVEYRVWGYELTLRLSDAKEIEIEKMDETQLSRGVRRRKHRPRRYSRRRKEAGAKLPVHTKARLNLLKRGPRRKRGRRLKSRIIPGLEKWEFIMWSRKEVLFRTILC